MTDPVFRRTTHIAVVGDDRSRVILLDLADVRGTPHALEGTAALIWSVIDGRRTLPQIVAEVAVLVDRTPAEVQPAIAAFVDELVGLHILVAVSEADSPVLTVTGAISLPAAESPGTR